MIDINTTDITSQSIIQKLKTTSGLPFEALLPTLRDREAEPSRVDAGSRRIFCKTESAE